MCNSHLASNVTYAVDRSVFCGRNLADCYVMLDVRLATMACHISALPNEILSLIFSSLQFFDIVAVCQVTSTHPSGTSLTFSHPGLQAILFACVVSVPGSNCPQVRQGRHAADLPDEMP